MIVKREVNLGTLFPIASFLILQSAAIVWWASGVSSDLAGIHDDVAMFQEMVKEEAQKRLQDRQEALARIVITERAVAEVVANERATAAVLNALQEDLNRIRNDIKETSDLTRQVLLKLGGADAN